MHRQFLERLSIRKLSSKIFLRTCWQGKRCLQATFPDLSPSLGSYTVRQWFWAQNMGLEAAGSQCAQTVCSAPGSLCVYSEITLFSPPSSTWVELWQQLHLFATTELVSKQKYLAHQIFWVCIILICLVCLCLGDLVIEIWPFIPADLFFRMLSHMCRLCSVLAYGSHVMLVNLMLPKKPWPC